MRRGGEVGEISNNNNNNNNDNNNNKAVRSLDEQMFILNNGLNDWQNNW